MGFGLVTTCCVIMGFHKTTCITRGSLEDLHSYSHDTLLQPLRYPLTLFRSLKDTYCLHNTGGLNPPHYNTKLRFKTG